MNKVQWVIWSNIALCNLLMVVLLVLFVSNTEVTRSIYWNMQQLPFVELNHWLSYCPGCIWANLTRLGDATVLMPLLFFAFRKQTRILASMLWTVPFAAAISAIGKHLFSMPRPAAVLDHNQINIIGAVLQGHNSLPSGHSITIFAALAVILTELRADIRQHAGTMTIVAVLAALVAISRVAVGAHWPLDIVVGALCGWIAGLVGCEFNHRFSRLERCLQSSNGQFAASIVFACLAPVLISKALVQGLDGVILWPSAAGCLLITLLAWQKVQQRMRARFRPYPGLIRPDK